jgi:hypothetical protein
MSNESENKTTVGFTLREFIDYLHANNYNLYCEVLDYVSERVAEERGLFLDSEKGDWGEDESGKVCVNLTDKDILED